MGERKTWESGGGVKGGAETPENWAQNISSETFQRRNMFVTGTSTRGGGGGGVVCVRSSPTR